MCIDGGTPNHATFFPCRLLVMVIWRPAVLKAYRYLQNWLKAMNSAANRNCPCFHSRGELRAQALSRARKFAKVVLNAHFTFIWPKWSFNGDNDNMIILHIYIIIHWTRRYPLSDKLIFRQSAMKYSQISVTVFCFVVPHNQILLDPL